MLEVDEDSRLGRELIAGGTRYHAHFVPDDDLTAEFYETACERLSAAGIEQYEISNFARSGFESQHNLKYWTRQTYLGFGVDAHSMLSAGERLRNSAEFVRLATTDDYDVYLSKPIWSSYFIDRQLALEESFFLGLRLNTGVDLGVLRAKFGTDLDQYSGIIAEFVEQGLLQQMNESLKLTARGRLLSNEVFQKFVLDRDPQSLGDSGFYQPIEAAQEKL
jgi:oxygen-independent coproporphyrinogen-3 oxidase